MKAGTVVGVLCTLVFSGVCLGDNCFQQHAVVQQFQSYPSINYFVGQPLRVEAIVRRQLQADPDYQEFLQFKRWKQETRQPIQKATATVPKTLLTTLCAQCHGKAAAAGGFAFDGKSAISPAKFQLIVSWASGKVKPKGEKMPGVIGKLISEGKTAQLLSELIDLQNQPGKE